MNFMELTEAEIEAIATPLMDQLMEASTRIDHAAHVRDFTDRLKAQVPEDRFGDMCRAYQQKLGVLQQRKLIGVLRRPDSAVILWRQALSKAQGEYLAEMVLVHDGERYLVDHAVFF